jgi:hypothetical protein
MTADKSLALLTFGQALQSGQGLSPIPLLDANVDVVCLRSNVLAVSERISLVCKGIYSGCQMRTIDKPGGNRVLTECVEVLHAHAMVKKRRKKLSGGS